MNDTYGSAIYKTRLVKAAQGYIPAGCAGVRMGECGVGLLDRPWTKSRTGNKLKHALLTHLQAAVLVRSLERRQSVTTHGRQDQHRFREDYQACVLTR